MSGAGTFLPVKADDTADHVMHAGMGQRQRRDGRGARTRRARAGGRIVAVGSTSLRLLESAAARGRHACAPFAGETALFITPGYRFRAVDAHADQFPSAALDPVHAGLRRSAASTRCSAPMRTPSTPATGSIPTAMPACCSANPEIDADRSRFASTPPTAPPARGEITTAARRGADAGLHAGRHAGAIKGVHRRRGARRPAPISCSATPIT